MEGERISREQQELCQQLGEHGKLPSTLQVRGVLTVDQRPRRSRLCTLLGPWYFYDFRGLPRCMYLLYLSLLQRADLTTCTLAVTRHLGINVIDIELESHYNINCLLRDAICRLFRASFQV